MKKLLLLLPLLMLLSFSTNDNTLTKEEKEYATKFLTETEQSVFNAVKGLSEAQLKFKASPDKWSIEECVKHIAISEKNIWGMIDAELKKPANPEKRTEIKATDEQVVKMIESREKKVKTSEAFEPKSTPYKTTEEALKSFKEAREMLISNIQNTAVDFRNHVSTLPMGSFDAFQMVLFLSAHTKRHTDQILEVKTDPNFPKS